MKVGLAVAVAVVAVGCSGYDHPVRESKARSCSSSVGAGSTLSANLCVVVDATGNVELVDVLTIDDGTTAAVVDKSALIRQIESTVVQVHAEGAILRVIVTPAVNHLIKTLDVAVYQSSADLSSPSPTPVLSAECTPTGCTPNATLAIAELTFLVDVPRPLRGNIVIVTSFVQTTVGIESVSWGFTVGN